MANDRQRDKYGRFVQHDIQDEKISEMYLQNLLSMREIAKIFSCDLSVIKRRLERLNIKLRDHKENQQRSFAKRRKGYTVHAAGYCQITYGENRNRRLHDVLMEKQIGRRLNSDEVVHHIDGDRRNNDMNNLALMTRSEHTKMHIANQTRRSPNGRLCK